MMFRCLYRSSPHGGFTLIEGVITITVLAIVGAMGAGILVESGRALGESRHRTDGFADAQYALARLDLDISGLANRDQVTTMAAERITINESGSDLVYRLNGTTLLRDGEVLARDVTRFALTYYRADGGLASTQADLHRIAAEITVSPGGKDASLRVEMFPRTFRDSYVPVGESEVDLGNNGRGGRRWWWLGRLWRWSRRRWGR